MKVSELREVLAAVPGDTEVRVALGGPLGWRAPDLRVVETTRFESELDQALKRQAFAPLGDGGFRAPLDETKKPVVHVEVLL